MQRETLELMTFVEDVWRQSGQLVVGQIDFFEIGKSGKGIVGDNVDSVVGFVVIVGFVEQPVLVFVAKTS